MCGVIGYVGNNAAQSINFGLSFLQHRGQDAAGIATLSRSRVFMEKGYGTAAKFFNNKRLNQLGGDFGIGHVRYTTSGDATVASEMQPFYVNQPYGMALVHNGNLTNAQQLRTQLAINAHRHISSDSDSEVLINVLADAIFKLTTNGQVLTADILFNAVSCVHQRCLGSYCVVVAIAGFGLLAFRDAHGIRPFCIGNNQNRWLIASESVTFRPLGITNPTDISPGEAVVIDSNRQLHRRQCAKNIQYHPCAFEYIYLARPDSTIENVSVYKARLNMGMNLAKNIRRHHPDLNIDCVIPVPDSGRIAAMQLAQTLNIPYREGLVKNRYIGRTFITAGQVQRQLSVRQKLNVIESEVINKSVLLVDDSIVRGTTGRELVALVRDCGAKKIYFASAAPPVRHPNVYGLDIPTHIELLAYKRNENEIAAYLTADRVIFQSLPDLIDSIKMENSHLSVETSCFDGHYPIGDINDEYLTQLAQKAQNRLNNNEQQQSYLPF